MSAIYFYMLHNIFNYFIISIVIPKLQDKLIYKTMIKNYLKAMTGAGLSAYEAARAFKEIKEIAQTTSTNELNSLEESILNEVAISLPYSFNECMCVYKRCKSFDMTISILSMACQESKSYVSILERMGY